MNTSRVAKHLVATVVLAGWVLLPIGAEAAGGDFEGPNFRISGNNDTGLTPPSSLAAPAL